MRYDRFKVVWNRLRRENAQVDLDLRSILIWLYSTGLTWQFLTLSKQSQAKSNQVVSSDTVEDAPQAQKLMEKYAWVHTDLLASFTANGADLGTSEQRERRSSQCKGFPALALDTDDSTPGGGGAAPALRSASVLRSEGRERRAIGAKMKDWCKLEY